MISQSIKDIVGSKERAQQQVVSFTSTAMQGLPSDDWGDYLRLKMIDFLESQLVYLDNNWSDTP